MAIGQREYVHAEAPGVPGSQVLDEPLVDPQARLRTLCHTVPGRWMIEGIGFYCGLVMRWFRDAFCELEQAEAVQEGVDVYAVLERKAAELSPGANGVVGLFSNVMQASHWVHAAPGFRGFDVSDPERSGRATCVRAIEESAAYVALGHLRIVEELTNAEVREAGLPAAPPRGCYGHRSLQTLWACRCGSRS